VNLGQYWYNRYYAALRIGCCVVIVSCLCPESGQLKDLPTLASLPRSFPRVSLRDFLLVPVFHREGNSKGGWSGNRWRHCKRQSYALTRNQIRNSWPHGQKLSRHQLSHRFTPSSLKETFSCIMLTHREIHTLHMSMYWPFQQDEWSDWWVGCTFSGYTDFTLYHCLTLKQCYHSHNTKTLIVCMQSSYQPEDVLVWSLHCCGEAVGLDTCFYQLWLSMEQHKRPISMLHHIVRAIFVLSWIRMWAAHTHNGSLHNREKRHE